MTFGPQLPICHPGLDSTLTAGGWLGKSKSSVCLSRLVPRSEQVRIRRVIGHSYRTENCEIPSSVHRQDPQPWCCYIWRSQTVHTWISHRKRWGVTWSWAGPFWDVVQGSIWVSEWDSISVSSLWSWQAGHLRGCETRCPLITLQLCPDQVPIARESSLNGSTRWESWADTPLRWGWLSS